MEWRSDKKVCLDLGSRLRFHVQKDKFTKTSLRLRFYEASSMKDNLISCWFLINHDL